MAPAPQRVAPPAARGRRRGRLCSRHTATASTPAGTSGSVVDVERLELGAVGVEPAAAPPSAVAARHERLGPVGPRVVERRPVLAGDLDHVGEALGGDQRDPGAPPLEQGVGGDRGAVGRATPAGRRRRAGRRPRRRARLARVARRRRHLGDRAVGGDEVGERAAGVDPDPHEHRLSRRPGGAPARCVAEPGVQVGMEPVERGCPAVPDQHGLVGGGASATRRGGASPDELVLGPSGSCARAGPPARPG